MEKNNQKAIILFLLSLFLASGCIHSEENLTLKSDGSGTVQANLVIPQATVYIIENVLSARPKENEESQQPLSIDSLVDKDKILEKAKAAGLDINFEAFGKETKDKALYISYKFKFDNIHKLLSTDILSLKLSLVKDLKGNLICSSKGDQEKLGMLKENLRQFIEWKNSQEKKGEKDQMYEEVIAAMKDFKMEFMVIFPNEVKEVRGKFSKAGKAGAELAFIGNFLEDPSIINRIYGPDESFSRVISGGKNLNFELDVVASQSDGLNISPQSLEKGTDVVLTLKNGRVVEAKLSEETQDYIQVSVEGEPVKYFFEEVKRIEYIIPQPK